MSWVVLPLVSGRRKAAKTAPAALTAAKKK